MKKHPFCVVTTIQQPTPAVFDLSQRFSNSLVVVGDKKTPKEWALSGVNFIPCPPWLPQKYEFEDHAPVNHYARKNLGYLEAMAQGASLIYDTDDDNLPNDVWRMRGEKVVKVDMVRKSGWCNVYEYFYPGVQSIWPRGFALEEIGRFVPAEDVRSISAPIQQGMVDGNPDVDAIWRLVMPPLQSSEVFSIHRCIGLAKGVWCPFNSQTTWWWPEAYPLMYLPATAPFRMTDIWRSFVAQRCLWELGKGVVFHSPAEVVQKRNVHNLLDDFKDEVPGYLNNGRIAEILMKVKLDKGVKAIPFNMVDCYAALVRSDIVSKKELYGLLAWVEDIKKIWKH